MDFIVGELGAIIALLLLIAWELGSIKKHLKGDD
jgi:hypothetical protein